MRLILPKFLLISALVLQTIGLGGCSTIRDQRLMIADLQRECQQLRQSRDGFLEENTQLKKERRQAEALSNQRISELEGQLSESERQREFAISEAVIQRTQLSRQMTNKLEQETSFSEKLKIALSESLRVQDELSTEVQRLVAEVQRLDQDNENQFKMLQKRDEELASRTEERNTLSAQLDQMRSEYQDAQRRLANAEEELTSLTAQMDALKTQGSRTAQDLNAKTTETVALQSALKTRERELANLNQTVADLKSDLAVLRKAHKDTLDGLTIKDSLIKKLKGDADSFGLLKGGMDIRFRGLETILEGEESASAKLAEVKDWLGSTREYVNERSAPLPAESALGDLYRDASSLFEDEIKEGQLYVKRVTRGVVVEVPIDSMFATQRDSGLTVIDAKGQETLRKLADLVTKYSDVDLLIEGHANTEPVVRSATLNNMTLTTGRAFKVYNELTDSSSPYKVNASRIRVVSCGEHYPVVDNKTPENRRRNKRIEFVFTQLY